MPLVRKPGDYVADDISRATRKSEDHGAIGNIVNTIAPKEPQNTRKLQVNVKEKPSIFAFRVEKSVLESSKRLFSVMLCDIRTVSIMVSSR